MSRLILFLGRMRAFTFFAILVYFSFVVFYHRKVSTVFDWLRDTYSFHVYNGMTLNLSILFLISFSAFVFMKLRKGSERLKKSILWGYTLLLVLISYQILITVNIEVIHYIQYALLAIPVFALVQRYGETVLLVTLLGALDEAYQYFVLYRDNNTVYLDFNDMILNLIGAGIGVLLIYTFIAEEHISLPARPWRGTRFKPRLIAAILAISLCSLGLYSADLVRSHPEEDAKGEFIFLSRQPAAPQFWTVPEKGKPYHRLKPIEGISILAVLLAASRLLASGRVLTRDGRTFF